MYYIEVLRTWRAYWKYLIVLAGLLLLTAFITALVSHGAMSPEMTATSAGSHAAGIAFVCLVFASIAGTSLSRHLNHLEFALTKPRSRSSFVATVFGIDAIGLAVFFATTLIGYILLHVALNMRHEVAFDASSLFAILLSFGSVLAWYALVQAVSCGREAEGRAIAIVWIVALGLAFLSALNLGPGLNGLVVVLNFVNPLSYLIAVPGTAISGPASFSLVAHTLMIYIVAAGAALIALMRWQRVDA